MTLNEFIAAHQITMTAELVPYNLRMGWREEGCGLHWRCTLSCPNGRSADTYWTADDPPSLREMLYAMCGDAKATEWDRDHRGEHYGGNDYFVHQSSTLRSMLGEANYRYLLDEVRE